MCIQILPGFVSKSYKLLEFELKVLSIFFISQSGCEYTVLALLLEISQEIFKYSHVDSNIDRLASLLPLQFLCPNI